MSPPSHSIAMASEIVLCTKVRKQNYGIFCRILNNEWVQILPGSMFLRLVQELEFGNS